MHRLVRPVALLSASALAIGGISLAALPGQAVTPLTVDLPEYESGLAEGGYIILQTGAQNRVGFLADSAVGEGLSADDTADIEWHQSLTSGNNCQLISSPIEGRDALLDFAAVNPQDPADLSIYTGLVGGSLGVRRTGKGGEGKGEPCGRADGLTQAIKVDVLGYDVTDFEIDVEGKFNADLSLTFETSNGPVQADVDLSTGSGSDNGPDSADGDNYIIVPGDLGGVDPFPFSSFTLGVSDMTPDGAVSLEGGSDFAFTSTDWPLGNALGTTVTILRVTGDATGTLGCPGTPPYTDSSVTGVSLTRLVNKDGSACELIPYALDREGNVVTFAKNIIDGQESAQFRMEVTWEPETASYPVERTTKVNYGNGAGEESFQWCEGTWDPADPDDVSGVELPAGVNSDPGITESGWCLLHIKAGIPADGAPVDPQEITVVETFYGIGDPRLNRL